MRLGFIEHQPSRADLPATIPRF